MDSTQRLQQIIEYELPSMKILGIKEAINDVEVIAEFDDGPCEVILSSGPHLETMLRKAGYSEVFSYENPERATIRRWTMLTYFFPSEHPLYHIFACAADVEKFGHNIAVFRTELNSGMVLDLSSLDINVHLIFQPMSGLAHYFLMPSRELARSEPERVMPGGGPYRSKA